MKSRLRTRSSNKLRLESLEPRRLLAADPVISEFMALNRVGLVDEDGDTSDWIEIHNRGDAAIDLMGWHLTDDVDDPDKWIFPATTLAAGEYSVIFASGKDRAGTGPSGEHHTNFRLGSAGGYLALVNPDGETTADSFSPEYPRQRAGISYGRARDAVGEPLVSDDTEIRAFVPSDNQLGPSWTGGNEPFNDASWVVGSPAVGFDQGGFAGGETYGQDVIDRDRIDSWFGTYVLREPLAANEQTPQSVTEWSFYNDNSNAVGRLITPVLMEQVDSGFVVRGIGQTRTVSTAGVQSYPFELQDGVSDFDPTQGSFHLAFRSGSPTVANPGVVEYTNSETPWTFLGSIASAKEIAVGEKPVGLEISLSRDYSVQFTLAQGGFGSIIGTDLESSMFATNASAYVRTDFTVSDLENAGGLELQLRYDDGFVAYLNGTEVARQNAPASVNYDSTATSDRSRDDILNFEVFDLSDQLDLLQVGQNVLAIHGLNHAVDSGDFLISPKLELLSTERIGYLTGTSPGASNDAAATDFVADTNFSVDRGFFDEAFDLEISSATPGASIVYTTDGSPPSETNGVIVAPPTANSPPVATITISGTTTLRAAAFKEGLFPTNADTQTYIFVSDVVDQSVMNSRITDDPVWGPQVEDALLALPTISLVTDANISQTESGTSIEMIFPDGSDGFQVDAGIEHFGGHSLNSQKRNMRLSFKQDYGPTKLNFDIYDNDPDAATSFDQLILRSGSHDNFFWVHPGGARGNYVRSRWAFDTQRAMGHVAPRGRYVHVYINGEYEGMHNLMERPNASFMAAYDGGDREDYDALNKGAPIDGDKDAWEAMKASIEDYDEFSQRIDIENYIDYMLMQFFGGNDWDWRANQNWAAAGHTDAEDGYKFFAWDSDVILRTGFDANVVELGGPENIWNLRGGPKQHEEFLQIFADRAQMHLLDGGVFTPEYFRNMVDSLASEIELAVIAESARWGHGSFSTNSSEYYTPAVWRRELEWMKDTYGALDGESRTELVISQLRESGVFPQVNAPQYSINGVTQQGGQIDSGAIVAMEAETVAITEEIVLLDQGSPVSAFVPSDASLETGAGPHWYELGFDATGWTQGTSGVGFENGSDSLEELIGTDVGADWNAETSSVYTRFEFELPADFEPDSVKDLTLRNKFDDGFVAYLNGEEIARQAAPAATNWQSNATSTRFSILSKIFQSINIDEHSSLLRAGDNVLAVHALNASDTDNDLVILPNLILERFLPAESPPIYYTLDGTDPRGADGTPAGTLYAGEFSLDESTQLLSRSFTGGQWSALKSADFIVPNPGGVLISEIHFNPSQPTAAELATTPDANNDDYEFIEIVNTHPTDDINLLGMSFSDGVEFEFPNVSLGAGERAVIVEDVDSFRQRYGEAPNVLGAWSGGLSNAGETIVLNDNLGQEMLSIDYNDVVPWPVRADGQGGSLVLVDESADGSFFGEPTNWRGSTTFDGTPGEPPVSAAGVVINEVLANTTLLASRSDSIELHNPTNASIDIGGWFLSDSAANLLKYQIPTGTVIGSGEYMVFDEGHFNPTPLTPAEDDFALSGTGGDDVWLVVPDGNGGVAQFVDDVHFGATRVGESYGLSGAHFAPLSRDTIGGLNSDSRSGPIVISEVQYNPGTPSAAATALWPELDANDLEFVELHNPTSADASLVDWKLRGGVDIDLAESLSSNETLLVVTFDPTDPDNGDRLAAFRAHYGLANDIDIVGGFAGVLSNFGERVALLRADQTTEDEVIYDDVAPWVAVTPGQSIQRRSSIYFASDAATWSVDTPTPGRVRYVDTGADLNGDGQVSSADMDLLLDAIRAASVSTAYDLNNDGTVDAEDADWLLNEAGTHRGDANWDGTVHAADLNTVRDHLFSNGKLWEHGDFTGDGQVDGSDFNIWLDNRFAALAADDAMEPSLNLGRPNTTATVWRVARRTR